MHSRPPRGSPNPSQNLPEGRPVPDNPVSSDPPKLTRWYPDLSQTSRRVPRLVPDLPEGLTTHPGSHRGFPKPSPTSPRFTRPVPDLPKGPENRPGPPLGFLDPSRFSPKVDQPVSDNAMSTDPPKLTTRYPDLSRTSRRVSRLVPDLPEGPPTCPGPQGGSADPSWNPGRVPQTVPDLPEGPPNRLKPP